MKRNLSGWLAVVAAMTLVAGTAFAGWETDFAKASSDASKSGSYMLVDFSGSDWCGWCMKLEKEVFSKTQFKEFADKNLVCVLVDFPRTTEQAKELKEQNKALAAKYGISGFPTVLILSPGGELVARTGYQKGGATKYVAYLKKTIEEHRQKSPAAKASTNAAPEAKP